MAPPPKPKKSDANRTATLVSETIHAHTSPLTQRSEAIAAASDAITDQEKKLVRDTKKLSQQADALEKTVDRSVEQLKEMGDLQNWAEVVFRDIAVLEETMRMVEEEREVQGSEES